MQKNPDAFLLIEKMDVFHFYCFLIEWFNWYIVEHSILDVLSIASTTLKIRP